MATAPIAPIAQSCQPAAVYNRSRSDPVTIAGCPQVGAFRRAAFSLETGLSAFGRFCRLMGVGTARSGGKWTLGGRDLLTKQCHFAAVRDDLSPIQQPQTEEGIALGISDVELGLN